jgi:hypothetical protein
MNRSEQLLAILAEECNEVAQKMQWKANNKLRYEEVDNLLKKAIKEFGVKSDTVHFLRERLRQIIESERLLKEAEEAIDRKSPQ